MYSFQLSVKAKMPAESRPGTASGSTIRQSVPTRLEPKNKEQLTRVLTYHVVPGRYDAAALMKAIRKGHGKASLTTAGGETLWIMMNGDRNLIVRDAKGGVANISTYDVVQSNGVINVVDRVLLPS